MSDEWATRREVDILRAEMSRMDDHGTRGVSVVQAQLVDVIKDVTELKTEISGRFAEHGRQHERDDDQRRSDRRWSLGFAVAIAGAVGGLYPVILHIHH